MSGLQPVAFWGLQVPAGDQLTMVASEIPDVNMFRITMAAIDPNAKPLEADQPKRATLKLIRRPLDHDDYEDDDEDDEDDEDESADEEELKKIQKKSKKLAKKGAQANEMKVDGEDSDEEEDSDDEGFETEEFVICTLDPERQYQQTLDIVVGEYEEAFFKVVGNFDVFLSGNYVVPADRDGEKDDEDDSEDEDEDDYDLSPDEDELMNMLGGGADDSEDELDDVENPRITEIDSEDEKKKQIEAKLTKAEKKGLKRAAEEEAKSEEPKLSKKQLKKLKANNGKAVETAQPETPESKKKVQFAKPIEQGPTNGQKDTKKTPEKDAKTPEKAEKAEKAASPATKKVVQGVTIEDKKTGTGPVAKNGAKLGMRYIGKLNNGKVFDSNTKGKPFTFRLGKGEVIKGWDVGLAGMQVGGERRIVIPANMAYGKKQLPGIPANSTLTFDVKLLEVK
ncbi:hypothetical protein K440DRAFT_601177 [Wilcoxina mikolae CBS 423.85]|nr:hypothetical protein K440DRAFT_601177 [Wilcoxina mikolae CBS 423.85]